MMRDVRDCLVAITIIIMWILLSNKIELIDKDCNEAHEKQIKLESCEKGGE